MNILLQTLIFLVGFNILMFIPAFIWKTDKLTDISYAVSFAGAILFLFFKGNQSLGETILLIMILTWAIRLGSYLFIRIRKMKRDKRFDGMREKFWSFLKFWLLQGVSVWVIMISSILYFKNVPSDFSTLAIIGIIIFLFGLIIETISDLQKYSFINNEENKGKWIDIGLWRYSRHPNYFGEILVWIGIFVFTLPVLSGINILYSAISPLYIFSIIMFATGIPLLEKRANQKWGDIPEYVDYVKKTSLLILLPRRKN